MIDRIYRNSRTAIESPLNILIANYAERGTASAECQAYFFTASSQRGIYKKVKTTEKHIAKFKQSDLINRQVQKI